MKNTNPPNALTLSRWMYGLWVYTLIVILWGAWVRMSHSGDGCGDHWPLCAGKVIPNFEQTKTWIEYTHRLMSGLYGIFVVLLFFKIKKNFVSKQIQKLDYLFLFFMISEALLGALLVKGQLVTENDSFTRLVVMSLHQLNSFMLTGVTYLLYLALKKFPEEVSLHNKKLNLIFILLPLTGAIAALSTTLFPAISVWQGILQDFSTQSHLFIRLRILHPLFAVTIGVFFISWLYIKNQTRFAMEFTFAVFIGIITLVTLSPVYLKLAHLGLAHYLWSRLLRAQTLKQLS